MTNVSNLRQLLQAIHEQVEVITVQRSMLVTTPLALAPGVTLQGEKQEDGELPSLSFSHSDGIGISVNNTVRHLTIQAPVTQRAIFVNSPKADLGTFHFSHLTISGQFSFITNNGFQHAELFIDALEIMQADCRHYAETQLNYGVTVRQGAFTIFNCCSDDASEIEVTATNITIGQKNAPVVGSGVFIAGSGTAGGRTTVHKLHTNAVYSNGKIPFGVANMISAAIFMLNNTFATEIFHLGPTVTYGVNDMVLDAWGTVEKWHVHGPIISYGTSGVGFVNFGTVHEFIATHPITTYGEGARGYNQYDGTLLYGEFDQIQTFGNGSVGIQISKKVGKIIVHRGITTNGEIGTSLVKGVNTELPAYALSMKDGGEIDVLHVEGNIETYGENVTTFITESNSAIHEAHISGEIIAHGQAAKAKEIAFDSQIPPALK